MTAKSIEQLRAEAAAISAAADQAIARAREKKARQLAALRNEERRIDTRRKVLAGAWLLAEIERDAELSERVQGGLRTYLAREDDRKIFGLDPLPESSRVDLAVPREQKEEAKALGAKWDGTTWYVPPGVDPAPLVARWPKP